MSSATGL